MAKAKLKSNPQVILILDSKEAEFLKSFLGQHADQFNCPESDALDDVYEALTDILEESK